ncbi:MAG: replication factor C large subunit [Nanoarchaeota archaeon]|nr:replication factor C large subunit [Nanoarchaeota archaeon]
MGEPYIRKYCPVKINEMVGQDEALKDLKDFISNFKRQRKNAAFVYGGSGIGKTCGVYAAANELGLEVVEVNASEFRNKEQINLKVGGAVGQQSLFSKGKVILVDEVDGLAGNKDRGGLQAMIRLIEKTSFPIILTATNPWDFKFNSLRSKSVLIKFNELDYMDIFKMLKRICKEEGVKCEDNILKGLSRMAGGDLRAAINDLQQLAGEEKKITKESLDELSQREQQQDIITALTKVLKTTDPKVAIGAFDYVKENLNEQLLWLDKNIPEEYTKPEDLARAYDKLSKADIFNRRIRRWQHWRFLVYINALITAGVAVSKDKKYDKFVQYKPTGRLLKIFWANRKNMKRKAIAAKIASYTHTSSREVLKSIDYFRVIFQKNKDMADKISSELDLDKEEAEWLRK